MSQKALSMRKIKEVLRLRYDLGLLQNEIARSCSIGQASVHRYLERASAAGLSWPLPEDWDDRRPSGGSPSVRGPVDFAAIHHRADGGRLCGGITYRGAMGDSQSAGQFVRRSDVVRVTAFCRHFVVDKHLN